MCGIAAVIGCGGALRTDLIRRMSARISHRGDPHLQCETKGGVGWLLSVNRMAITSHDDKPQPVRSEDKSVWLAFNGEIYNWRQLANEYSLDQDEVSSSGDGFVMACVIAKEMSSAAGRLRGMFAAIAVDVRAGMVYVLRDCLGIKPLYYSRVRDEWWFASEIKSLASEDDVREIFEVEPGTVMCFALGGDGSARIAEEIMFFQPETIDNDDSDESPMILRRHLVDAVGRCCDHRDKVGVYLSGGVDSAGVYALARQARSDVLAIILGREGASDLQAACRLTSEVGGEAIVGSCPSEEELFEVVDETIEIVESFEPNLVRQSSVQRRIAALGASAGIRVLLCGEGADELFCGYPEFSRSEDWSGLRLRFLRDLHRTQLQRVDRCAMHLTTEVRVPYLERDVVELALSRSRRGLFLGERGDGADNKLWLRESLRGIVPEWIRGRPKVVLSEGAGLGGNHPTKGLFSALAQRAISSEEAKEIIGDFHEWRLRSAEEAFYFKVFLEKGYAKASFMKHRVMANRINSLEEEGGQRRRWVGE